MGGRRGCIINSCLGTTGTQTPTRTCSCSPHLRPANWGRECQSAHHTCSLRLDVAWGHSPSLVLFYYHSRIRAKSFDPDCQCAAARNIAAGLRLAIRQSVCIVRERRREIERERGQGAPAVSYRQSGEVVATLSFNCLLRSTSSNQARPAVACESERNIRPMHAWHELAAD